MDNTVANLIDKWKKGADKLVRHNENEHDQCLYFQNKGSISQLRKCISEIEAILISKTPTLEDAYNAGIDEGVTRAGNAEWGIKAKATTFKDWYKSETNE